MDVCRIGIVDDHKIVRDGLCLMLKCHPAYRVLFGVDSIKQLFEQLSLHQPDILILDLNLPGTNGLEIIGTLRVKYPDVKILVLSSDSDEQSIMTAIDSGVHGYISKDAGSDELLRAIDTLSEGDEFFGETVSGIIYQSYLKSSSGSSDETMKKNILSEREQQILGLFAEGCSYKKIAEKLNISSRTVETHRANIMMKLGLENLSQLVRYAIKNGIISL